MGEQGVWGCRSRRWYDLCGWRRGRDFVGSPEKRGIDYLTKSEMKEELLNRGTSIEERTWEGRRCEVLEQS